MKHIFLLFSILLLTASCTIQQHASDEMYYFPGENSNRIIRVTDTEVRIYDQQITDFNDQQITDGGDTEVLSNPLPSYEEYKLALTLKRWHGGYNSFIYWWNITHGISIYVRPGYTTWDYWHHHWDPYYSWTTNPFYWDYHWRWSHTHYWGWYPYRDRWYHNWYWNYGSSWGHHHYLGYRPSPSVWGHRWNYPNNRHYNATKRNASYNNGHSKKVDSKRTSVKRPSNFSGSRNSAELRRKMDKSQQTTQRQVETVRRQSQTVSRQPQTVRSTSHGTSPGTTVRRETHQNQVQRQVQPRSVNSFGNSRGSVNSFGGTQVRTSTPTQRQMTTGGTPMRSSSTSSGSRGGSFGGSRGGRR